MSERVQPPGHLEECPCCKGAPELRRIRIYCTHGYAVVCTSCGMRTGNWYVNQPQVGPQGVIECTRYSDQEARLLAIATWNHRERLKS